MSDRSGLELVDLTVLEAVQDVSEGRRRWQPGAARALAQVEARIGLGPRHSYQVMLDLARSWIIPLPLIRLTGEVNDRAFPPTPPEETDCRLTEVGRAVLSAEAGRLGPVPLGIITGTLWRGGIQPSLEPHRVLRLLRELVADPALADGEILEAIGGPYSPAGCDLAGDLDALAQGKTTTLRETGRITITGAAAAPAKSQEGTTKPNRAVAAAGPGPRRPADLLIESLPATVGLSDTCREINSRLSDVGRAKPPRELGGELRRPITELWLESPAPGGVRIAIRLSPGYEPATVREQLAAIDGVYVEASSAFPAPLAVMMRSWIGRHRREEVAVSLLGLETAIDQDHQ